MHRRAVLTLAASTVLASTVRAQASYPDRPITLVVPAPPGGGTDLVARLYSDLQLQAELLQRLPVSAWTLAPDGTPDFVNQVWLEYSGQTPDFFRSRPAAWMTAVQSATGFTSLKARAASRPAMLAPSTTARPVWPPAPGWFDAVMTSS